MKLGEGLLKRRWIQPRAETFSAAKTSVRSNRGRALLGHRALVTNKCIEEKKVSINLNEFRRTLEAKRNELLSDAGDRDEILIENAAEEFDRLQQQLNREVAIRNLDRTSKLLKSVQAALARINDETYGVCLRCDEEIPAARLKAVPWAGYCIACQEKIDRQRASGEAEDDGHTTDLAA
jgi:DnaK suppressor protein